jgi:hypothetical protein
MYCSCVAFATCRYGYSFLLLLTAPAIYCMSMVQNATGFIIARLFIGFSLAAFVCCQVTWLTEATSSSSHLQFALQMLSFPESQLSITRRVLYVQTRQGL